MKRTLIAGSVLVLCLCGSAIDAFAELPRYETVEIDPQIGNVCYAVTVSDVDGDGDLDAVAISESQAVWYENPSWQKRVMVADIFPRDFVCIAPHDIDGDGQVDFAIGAGWPQNGGSIHWIHRRQSLDDPWVGYQIASEPWTHRMQFADVLGKGSNQLVVSPLNATSGLGVRLLAFPIPEKPRENRWAPVVIDGTLNRLHNHLHFVAAGDSQAQTLLASESGIARLQPVSTGGFELISIASGASGATPAERGAGEIKRGQFGPGRGMLGTIEPMHGNQVVIYLTDDPERPTTGQRVVLDDTYNQGHAIAFADLDGDGVDEVIAGFRQPREVKEGAEQDLRPGIYLYRAIDGTGQRWEKQPLDKERMACEDLTCADFNGDGVPDILAGGRATKNVRLYLSKP
jgi:hypothetical protein